MSLNLNSNQLTRMIIIIIKEKKINKMIKEKSEALVLISKDEILLIKIILLACSNQFNFKYK